MANGRFWYCPSRRYCEFVSSCQLAELKRFAADNQRELTGALGAYAKALADTVVEEVAVEVAVELKAEASSDDEVGLNDLPLSEFIGHWIGSTHHMSGCSIPCSNLMPHVMALARFIMSLVKVPL